MRAWRRERGQDALAPRGPVATARGLGGWAVETGLLSEAGNLLSLALGACAEERRGRLRAATASDGRWGRGHLALAMRRKAHCSGGGLGHARLAARARARCPRPQGPRRHCKGARRLGRRNGTPFGGRQSAFPGARACAEERRGRLRAATASDGRWGRGHLALAMRRKAHCSEGGLGHARLAARARARCPRPQCACRREGGQDALAACRCGGGRDILASRLGRSLEAVD